jgi:hypothetical protein
LGVHVREVQYLIIDIIACTISIRELCFQETQEGKAKMLP